MTTYSYVSVHGGHSGQFCHHGKNTLEEIVLAYIDQGFSWVGITEHIPPAAPSWLYPDEVEAGLTISGMTSKFSAYMKEARRLQDKYSDRIEILVGFETETLEGYQEHIQSLLNRFRPDYMVGSLHHVEGMGFDFSPEQYRDTAEKMGGLNKMYHCYFDSQFEMIQALKPSVVGHFDLIRLFDPQYEKRLALPEIKAKILRNLELIRNLDLILDFNLRALLKGAPEPYISKPILDQALEMGIAVVPGDDSHGVRDVGKNMQKGISILESAGSSLGWKKPKIYDWNGGAQL